MLITTVSGYGLCNVYTGCLSIVHFPVWWLNSYKWTLSTWFQN